MKRLILRLMSALLTFAVGVAAVSLWLNNPSPSPQVIHIEALPSIPKLTEQPISFEPKGSACGYIEKGGRFSDQIYESSDGVGVGYFGGDYGSAARAERELGRKLKEAIQIIERTSKLNAKGRRVGRVVALFPPIAHHKESASVFWTDGSGFYAIDAPSLKHALEFEKSIHR